MCLCLSSPQEVAGICFSIPLHLAWLFYLLWPIGCDENYLMGLLSFGFKRPCNIYSCPSGMLLPSEEAQTSLSEDERPHGARGLANSQASCQIGEWGHLRPSSLSQAFALLQSREWNQWSCSAEPSPLLAHGVVNK